MKDCPFCRENSKPTYGIVLHIWHKHILVNKGKLGWIATILFLLSIVANILQVSSFIFNKDSQRIQNIEQTITYCSLKEDFENASICLSRKGVTLKDVSDYIDTHKNKLDKKFLIGLSYLYNGSYDLSIAYFEQALENNPLNYIVHSYLEYDYYQKKDFDKTIEEGEKCLVYDKNSNWCKKGLALAYAQTNQHEKAINIFNQEINQLGSSYFEAQHNLAFEYFLLGECRKSIEIYQKIATLTKNPCEFHDLALNFALLGEKENATKNYEIAKAIDKNYMAKCYPRNNDSILIYQRKCENNGNCTMELSLTNTSETLPEIAQKYGLLTLPYCH